MAEVTIKWREGEGNIVLSADSMEGSATLSVRSDTPLDDVDRDQSVRLTAAGGSVSATLNVRQEGRYVYLSDRSGVALMDKNNVKLKARK